MKGINEEQKQLQRFSPEQIASSVMHKDFSEAHEALQMSKYYLDAAKLSTADIDGSPVSGEDRIAVGLIKRTLAEETGKTEDQLDPGPQTYDSKGQAKPGKYTEANASIIAEIDRRIGV